MHCLVKKETQRGNTMGVLRGTHQCFAGGHFLASCFCFFSQQGPQRDEVVYPECNQITP
jgi:hypothetical protein